MTWKGGNSLLHQIALLRYSTVRFKNWWRHVFKNVLCDVRQVVTLWNSAKETARRRDHSSRSFRTPRNEDSQNLKPLSTSESAKTILLTSESQELHPASWQAQKHIPCIHGSSGMPSLVRSLVLSGLVSCITLSLLYNACITLQPRSLAIFAVRDVIFMKQSDWSATGVALGTKTE